MAKLKYLIGFQGSGGSGDTPQAGVRLQYLGGAAGVPQGRIYEIVDTPPAFVNIDVSILSAIDDDEFYVDYKDDGVASQQLAKINLVAFADSCYNDGVYVNPGYQLIRFENHIEFHADTSAGASIMASIDGGLTYKSVLYSGGSPTAKASWTNAEIAAMGHINSIPEIRIKRNKFTNVKNIEGFEESDYPGFSGPGFTLVNITTDTTSGLIVGQTISFKNTFQYIDSQIVAIPGPDYIVINQNFVGNPAGVQTGVSVNCESVVAEDMFIGEVSFTPFSASETHTNETSTPANDGTINVNITGGSGDFTFLWNDGSPAQNRTNLQAGTYSVTITDNVTAQEQELEITITEPAPEEIPIGTYADVPKMQAFRFVREAIIDDCEVFQNFDNTLFCKMVFHGIAIRTPFYQKVCKCDLNTIQLHSNFPAHQIDLLRSYDGASVRSYSAALKQQLTGITSAFNGYLTDRAGTDPAGTSRFFFYTGTIPVLVHAGDVFTLVNNAEGFNGAYQIVGVSNDPLLGAPYLLITLTYDGEDATSEARAIFLNNVVNFDVYETVFTFNGLPEGFYTPRIRFINLDDTYTEFIGEPIHLKEKHPGTHLVEARNSDNAQSVVYTTGITHRIRLESSFKDPLFTSEDEIYRESNGDPVVTSSKPQRRFRLDWYNQPFYRHELLGVLLGYDFVTVNKVSYARPEAPGEPKARPFYLLTNGSAILEQKSWFADYNGHDLEPAPLGVPLTVDNTNITSDSDIVTSDQITI
jgi:hypothetical protein